MPSITDAKELILHCTHVNCNYMRLPAGELDNYQAISRLYQRLAEQSRVCAQSWCSNLPCPEHEPAVDAFWHAVVAWADALGISMGVDPVEWRVFVKPHFDFAEYLRPGEKLEVIEPHAALPAEVIIELDVRWMRLVVKLTTQWGLFHHLKDRPALREAERLERELRNGRGLVRDAYLRSDLKFFGALFKPFPFKYQTRHQIKDWLAMADPDNDEWRDSP